MEEKIKLICFKVFVCFVRLNKCDSLPVGLSVYLLLLLLQQEQNVGYFLKHLLLRERVTSDLLSASVRRRFDPRAALGLACQKHMFLTKNFLWNLFISVPLGLKASCSGFQSDHPASLVEFCGSGCGPAAEAHWVEASHVSGVQLGVVCVPASRVSAGLFLHVQRIRSRGDEDGAEVWSTIICSCPGFILVWGPGSERFALFCVVSVFSSLLASFV